MGKYFLNIFLTVLLLIMSISLYRVLNSHSQIESQVGKLNKVLDSQEKKNIELSSKYNYYNSEEYLEKISHDQLNLTKNNQYIVVIPKDNGKISDTGIKDDSSTKIENSEKKGNLEQWVDLLIN